MTRGLLYSFLFIAVLGATYFLFRADRRIAALPKPSSRGPALYQVRAEPRPIASTPTPSVVPQKAPLMSERADQLANARERLQEIAGNLQALQAQQAQISQQQQAGNKMMSRMGSNQAEIENLTDLLQSQRLATTEIDRQADQALRDQSSVAQANRDQIETNIQLLEEAIRQSQAQITAWLWNNVNYSQTQEQLASWRASLAEQTQQLQELRLQRSQISAGVVLQNRSIASQAQQQKDDIYANEAAIQSEIASLRDEIANLRSSQSQLRQSSMSLTEQIQQEQKNYQEQQKRVSELESSSAP